MRIVFAIAALSMATCEAVSLRREDSLAQTAIEADAEMLGAAMGAMGGGGPPKKATPEGAKSQVASGINLINAEKNMMLIPTASPMGCPPSLAQTSLYSY